MNLDTINTLSLNGEAIQFPSQKLLVFDIFHIEHLRTKKHLFLNSEYSVAEIESAIFDWSDGLLLGIYHLAHHSNSKVHIEVSQIKRFIETDNKEKAFGTDSAVICIIDYNQISIFLNVFNYDEFVDTLVIGEAKTTEYIRNIEQSVGTSFAIISTPGIGKSYNFDGSGRYIIENDSFE